MNDINDFPQDTRVVLEQNPRNAKGIIITNSLTSEPNMTVVEWDGGALQKVHVNLLKKESSLKDEFRELKISVDAKLKAAVDLLSAADREASDKHYSLMFDFNTNELVDLLNDIGWISSSC